MKASNVILSALGVLALAAFGLEHYDIWPDAHWLYLPLVILIAALYMIREDIDLFFAKKQNRTLSKGELNFLEQLWYLYGYIDEDKKDAFKEETKLKIISNEYRDSSGNHSIPKEIILTCAASATLAEMLSNRTFGNLVYVFYRHPFHSPEFPYLHIEEWYEQDSTFIFSMPHFVEGNREPQKHLDICLYTHLMALMPDQTDLAFNSSFTTYLMKPAELIHSLALKSCVRLAE